MMEVSKKYGTKVNEINFMVINSIDREELKVDELVVKHEKFTSISEVQKFAWDDDVIICRTLSVKKMLASKEVGLLSSRIRKSRPK